MWGPYEHAKASKDGDGGCRYFFECREAQEGGPGRCRCVLVCGGQEYQRKRVQSV